jgi:RNA polymerase sigma factor (sigma-70 family)
MPRTERSDAELLAADDAASFGLFYARHIDLVLVHVRRRVPRPDLAFDLAAEAFARALAARRQFDPERGPAVAWLLTIAKNLIVDAARRGQVDAAARARLAMEPVLLDDERIAEVERRASVDIEAILARLPAPQRDAVRLRVLDEASYPTIAEETGCSEQVARQRVSRGLAFLRRTLEHHS